MRGPRPRYLPPEHHWALYQNLPKHRWADIAYLMAVQLAEREPDKTPLDLIREYDQSITEVVRATR